MELLSHSLDQYSRQARKSFGYPLRGLRKRTLWICLFVVPAVSMSIVPASGQVVVMQDMFTYSSSNINGHSPTTGTGTWITNYSSSSNISTSGSQAVISVNGGRPGAGSAIASLPIALTGSSTLYTLTATMSFAGTSASDCWCAFGFSSVTSGPNQPGNIQCPWLLIRPQSSNGANGASSGYYGAAAGHLAGNWTVPAAEYRTVTASITYNTQTMVAQYYIDGALQGSVALTGPQLNYVVFEGYQTGNLASLDNITLTAQTIQAAQTSQVVQMQDNFCYTASNINGQAPGTTVSGMLWSTNNSAGSSIAATGTQANLIVNSGTVGAGSVIANYGFIPSANSFYTLRITYNFNGPVGSGQNCWAGMGFSTVATGGSNGSNSSPWLYIQPQGVVTDSPGMAGMTGTTTRGAGNLAATNYSSPITATITWNTSTGEARYYVNNLLQSGWTCSTMPSGGSCNAFFEGFQSGTAVSVCNITLTGEPLPLPPVSFGCPSWDNAQFPSLFDSGTGSAAWASAQSHIAYENVPPQYFDSRLNPNSAEIQQFLTYLKANNLKLMLGYEMLTQTGTCAVGEGYDPAAYANTIASNIQSLSGTGSLGEQLDMIQMDEPLYYGHDAKCLLSINTIAQQASQTAQTFEGYFPNLTVSDIEPMSSYDMPSADVPSWISAYQNAAGVPLVSLSDDLDWRLPLSQTQSTAEAIIQAGIPFGMCFTGDSYASTSNAQWMLCAMESVQLYYASALPALTTEIEFADWDSYTTQLIPETSPSSLTYLIDYFFASPYAVEAPPVALYELYRNGVHFYTANANEEAIYAASGWTDEGVVSGLYASPQGAMGLVPLSGYYKASNGTYAFAKSGTEAATLTANGFAFQTLAGYVFPDATTGGVPLYCAISPTGDYFYTTGTSQYQSVLNQGYTGMGIECALTPRWVPLNTAPYSTWQSSWFTSSELANATISGDTADPAGDGIPNLMKYALGLDPWAGDASGLPVIGITTLSGSNYLTLSYREVLTDTDITYTVEVSSDLMSWYSGAGYTVLVSTSNNENGTSTFLVRDAIPIGGFKSRFIRLQVTGP